MKYSHSWFVFVLVNETKQYMVHVQASVIIQHDTRNIDLWHKFVQQVFIAILQKKKKLCNVEKTP